MPLNLPDGGDDRSKTLEREVPGRTKPLNLPGGSDDISTTFDREAPRRTLTLKLPDGADEKRHPLVPVTEDILEIQGELGRGGMAVVMEARQKSIDRQVAVKMPLPGKSIGHYVELEREAYVLGLLEHPNILPIYTYTEQDGIPALVVKKVSGHLWSELIGDASEVKMLFQADDILKWNIEILLKVMDAVSFAHSQGIIHRDLKPSNVMIGAFGQVYLMDWGLAAGIEQQHREVLPIASEIEEVAGTTVYMAPEMVSQKYTKISDRTDAYLLGAILYQIMTGLPPHAAENEDEIMRKIWHASPTFSDHLPDELVCICRKALRRKPGFRYDSVEEFQSALKQYLQHRGARILLFRAHELLNQLRFSLEEGVERAKLYSVFGPCRFAFQEAAKAWQGSREAAAGLRESTELMVDYELYRENPEAAASLLGESSIEEGTLYDLVQAALENFQAKQTQFLNLQDKADTKEGEYMRRRVLVVVAVGWILVLILMQSFLRVTTYWSQVSSHLVFIVLWAGFGLAAKEWITAKLINSRLYKTIALGAVFSLVLDLGSSIAGISAEHAHAYHLFVFLACAMIAVAMVDWRIWPAVIAFFVAYLVGAKWPEYTLLAMAISNAVLACNCIVIWSRGIGESYSGLRQPVALSGL